MAAINFMPHYTFEDYKNCKKCIAILPVDWKIAEDTIVQSDNLVLYGEVDLAKNGRFTFKLDSEIDFGLIWV
ncbi:MAG: hypothetical protein GXO62_00025 [Epsilonproteobacteria bacterium]|nr:hypothetical protein [Campylobacterota bacterium]